LAVADLLPYLRRYARALTGNQKTGDTYAAATLEALLSDRSVFEMGFSNKVALFRCFHTIWSSAGAPVQEEEDGLAKRAQAHLSKLTQNTREALLLHTIEEFEIKDIADIMDIDTSEAQHLINVARQEMGDSVSGRVLVIEDEAIIAMDLQDIVADMGHSITGVGRTAESAVKLAEAEKPDLILSDIQLADGSSGIDAVNEILKAAGDIPVIFITAFPERLLTGERPEPAFVITKPYSEEQVRSAVSQAMFFSSTDMLHEA
jgi:CheY-like chemotaxis protein/DNA-directed RNA polymerase specialized sigma24 family protein